jgi:hypothetical protein
MRPPNHSDVHYFTIRALMGRAQSGQMAACDLNLSEAFRCPAYFLQMVTRWWGAASKSGLGGPRSRPFVQHAAEGPNIGLPTHGFAFQLLRTHVPRGFKNDAFHGSSRIESR